MKPTTFLILATVFAQLSTLAYANKPREEAATQNKKVARVKSGKQQLTPVIYYSILSKSSGHAMAISMASTANNAVAIEWTARLGDEQQWILEHVENEWFQIVAKHSDKVLTVRDDAKNPLVQGTRNSDPSTHWKLQNDSDGFVRIINRKSKQALEIAKAGGAHGDGILQRKKSDTDRQKWSLMVAEIAFEKQLPFQKLSLPAKEIIGKEHPDTLEELREFLHETTWSIRYGSPSGKEEYKMSFDKAGTLTLNTGRVSKLEILGLHAIRLWDYDTAILSDSFNTFQAVDANRKVYYGVLLPPTR